ncbi:helix-turn-helix domain-containing protein [Sphingobium yanoikuyae]|uniref:Helix-turn-helix domain-containing protein n=1 Tax=Sphingobium yanoikuyae TaxID=13690 RepID=A0A430BDH6_SPHYA|nr:helix-turn-helix domain-containing protein [Sphingobium yanoikuyae]RSU46919.1 helix-turn-helix domain-containing protein [Sphingobium yanoikuyae]
MSKASLMPGEANGVAAALGARVVALRKKSAGMTQKQLAAAAGLSQPYLAKIEAGRQDISLRVLARLGKALTVELVDLVDGIDISAVELESRPYSRSSGSD